MKMTIITDSKGELLGSTQGECSRLGVTEQAEISVGLLPGPDQKFVEIEVPDDFAKCDASELHKRLKEHLSKHKPKA